MPPMYEKKLNEMNKVRGGIFACSVISTEPTRKLKQVQQATTTLAAYSPLYIATSYVSDCKYCLTSGYYERRYTLRQGEK